MESSGKRRLSGEGLELNEELQDNVGELQQRLGGGVEINDKHLKAVTPNHVLVAQGI